jgi:hypothetical protein
MAVPYLIYPSRMKGFCQVLVSSIKGVKKKTLLLWPEFFLPSSPPG